MTAIKIREYVYNAMVANLESMCAHLAAGEKDLFRYYAGKAGACMNMLEEVFGLDKYHFSEHIQEMWDIMDENW